MLGNKILMVDVWGNTQDELEKMLEQCSKYSSYFVVNSTTVNQLGVEILDSFTRGKEVFVNAENCHSLDELEEFLRAINERPVFAFMMPAHLGKSAMHHVVQHFHHGLPLASIIPEAIHSYLKKFVGKELVKEKFVEFVKMADECEMEGLIVPSEYLTILNHEDLFHDFTLIVNEFYSPTKVKGFRKDRHLRALTPSEAVLENADFIWVSRKVLEGSNNSIEDTLKIFLQEVEDGLNNRGLNPKQSPPDIHIR